jgi:hypothetical protein
MIIRSAVVVTVTGAIRTITIIDMFAQNKCYLFDQPNRDCMINKVTACKAKG